MTDRLTLATSTGLPFLSLAFHVGTGLTALAAGFLALALRKGGKWHRVGGRVFVVAMIATGITATAISLYEGKESFAGGLVTAYLVFTAYTTVKPLPRARRQVDVALMVMAFVFGTLGYVRAVDAFGRPGSQIEGVPAGMMFFMTTIVMLAAIGDARMVLAGGITGARRLARHLWRMCFGLFIASGSFLIGQMKFIPEPIRIGPLLGLLAVSPLVMLLYWMWRVRLRQNLRGMMTATPIEARRPA